MSTVPPDDLTIPDDLSIPLWLKMATAKRAENWEHNLPKPQPKFDANVQAAKAAAPIVQAAPPPPPPKKVIQRPRGDEEIAKLPLHLRRWDTRRGRWVKDELWHLTGIKPAKPGKTPAAQPAAKAARAGVQAGKLKGKHLEIFNLLVQRPMTKAQVAEAVGMAEHSAGARMSELAKVGYKYLQEKNPQGKYTFQIIEGPPGEDNDEAGTGASLGTRNDSARRRSRQSDNGLAP